MTDVDLEHACLPCSDDQPDDEPDADSANSDLLPGPVRRNETSVVDGVKLRSGTGPTWWYNDKGGRGTNVTFLDHKRRKKWRAQMINNMGKLVHIGYYKKFKDAVEARRGVEDGVIGPGVLEVRDDGTIYVTKCSHCCRPFPLGHFAPVPCLKNLQKLPRFEAATAALTSADLNKRNAAWEALNVMPVNKKGCTALRTAWCYACREIHHKSETEGNSHTAACYQTKIEIRADMARRGCQHLGCTERRPECFEGDHEGRVGKLCEQYKCTNYFYFAGKYGKNGPAEMWKCYNGTQTLCKNHHAMEDSHNSARGIDSSTIEDAKAKRKRENHEECGAYNNKLKSGKTCKYCPIVFTLSNARMGAWIHPADGGGKTSNVGTLVGTGASLKTMKPRIDRVIHDECHDEIACHNCHHVHDTYPMYTRQMERYRALVATVHLWISSERAVHDTSSSPSTSSTSSTPLVTPAVGPVKRKRAGSCGAGSGTFARPGVQTYSGHENHSPLPWLELGHGEFVGN